MEVLNMSEKRIVIRFPRLITEGSRQLFETLGFEFCECDQLDDKLYETVLLPPGWKKEKRDLFYKDIKAPNGVTRAIIFAQKASTLRGTEPKAYVALLRRFYVDYRFDNDDRFYEVIVGDNERKVVLRKWSVGNSKYNSPEFKKAIKEAREFLDKKYPNWNDHLAYWSE